jgi:hypothetical protein
MHSVLEATGGKKEYYHESGKISTVLIEIAGIGMKKVWNANLSPETPHLAVLAVLSIYGEVRGMIEET